MKIFVTGSTGFLGSNLIEKLKEYNEYEIYTYNSKSQIEELDVYLKDCDFVFNFAAIHRPKSNSEFFEINCIFFQKIIDGLLKYKNYCPILFTSSIQAGNDTAYGQSKIIAENMLRNYHTATQGRGILYRLTNVFGKGARPNGHSVVATFCYNLQHDLPIYVSDPSHKMEFYYVEDVIDSFLERINEKKFDDNKIYYLRDDLKYIVTLGELSDLLKKFKNDKDSGVKTILNSEFEKKLYKTFVSYGEND